MKRIVTLAALAAASVMAYAQIYIVGNAPFGDWNPGAGVQMTQTRGNVYTYDATISGNVWFVFADGLTSDWTTFNDNYRYGPTGDASETVSAGTLYTTQKSSANHSYKFTGSGDTYRFTFNADALTFRIDLATDAPTYETGDVNGDGEVNIADVNSLISIILGNSGAEDYVGESDVNGDGEINIADVNAVIAIILGNSDTPDTPDDPPSPSSLTGYEFVWDENVLPEIHLEVSLDEWNRLLSLYDGNHYTTQSVMAAVTYIHAGDTVSVDSIGLRLKGNTSRRRPEGSKGETHQANNANWHHAHFQINTRKFVDRDGHDIRDIRKIHLKWYKDDATYVREQFCYDLFRRAGVWTGKRDWYCRLWIHVVGDSKEAYFGIYEMLEPIDKRFLKDRKEQFGSSKGYLWKCRNAAAGLNNPDNGDFWYDDDSDDRHAYTLQTREEEFDSAKVQFQSFMRKLNKSSDSEFYTWISEVMDVDLLLRTYAINVAVGMWDDYWNNANNYYLYFNGRHLTGYQVFFIPYDYDNTLGTSLDCGVQSDAVKHDPLQWGSSNNPLIARLLKFSDYKAKYVAYLKEMVAAANGLMDKSSAQSRIRAWQSLIAPYVDNDTGEDTSIRDVPASWGNHSEYRILEDSNNFFTVKASVINGLSE